MLFVVILFSLVGTSFVRAGHSTLIRCPTCEHHVCDVNNLMQCQVCQIIVPHRNQPPQDVKCVHTGHCQEDEHKHCCENEACVESIFGTHFGSVTVMPISGSHQASFAECPRCHDHKCDFVHRDHCSVCKFDLHDGQLPHVHCLSAHEHCDPTHKNTLCCTNESCIAQAFGHFYSTTHGASTKITSTTAATTTEHSMATNVQNIDHTDMFSRLVPCPVCEHGCDVHNAPLCETCHITFHNQQPQTTKCTQLGHCKDEDNKICCTDEACVENVFGNISRIMPTSSDGEIYCPACHDGACVFNKCKLCHYQIKDGQLPHYKGCTHQGNHECTHDGHQCCKDYHCIDSLFGSHFQSPIPTTQTTPTTEASTTTTHTTKDTSQHTTTNTSTTTKTTTTHKVTTTAKTTPSATTHDHHTTTTATTHKSTTKTPTTVPSTTASTSPNGSTSSCTDELNNCLMFKNMGVCHAIPEQGYTYEIAFKCRHTCERCNEIYQPLTTAAPTIPTTTPVPRAALNCQVCGDYDNNIPCDLVSIYKGPFVACSDGAYCMNDVVHEQGNVKTFKRCVNETVCRHLWLSQSSDQEHCTNYGNVMASGDYSCHYCCTTDRCNRGLIPDASTFYTKA